MVLTKMVVLRVYEYTFCTRFVTCVFNVSLQCAFRIGLLWSVIHVEFTGRNVTDAHCVLI